MIDLDNYVYDNGCCLLGSKKQVVNMIYNNMLIEEDDNYYQELLKDIEDLENKNNLKDNDILVITYGVPTGYIIEVFQEKDKIKDIEELEVI